MKWNPVSCFSSCFASPQSSDVQTEAGEHGHQGEGSLATREATVKHKSSFPTCAQSPDLRFKMHPASKPSSLNVMSGHYEDMHHSRLDSAVLADADSSSSGSLRHERLQDMDRKLAPICHSNVRSSVDIGALPLGDCSNCPVPDFAELSQCFSETHAAAFQAIQAMSNEAQMASKLCPQRMGKMAYGNVVDSFEDMDFSHLNNFSVPAQTWTYSSRQM